MNIISVDPSSSACGIAAASINGSATTWAFARAIIPADKYMSAINRMRSMADQLSAIINQCPDRIDTAIIEMTSGGIHGNNWQRAGGLPILGQAQGYILRTLEMHSQKIGGEKIGAIRIVSEQEWTPFLPTWARRKKASKKRRSIPAIPGMTDVAPADGDGRRMYAKTLWPAFDSARDPGADAADAIAILHITCRIIDAPRIR